MDLLSNLARKEDLGASVDSHGIWVEAKVLILIEVKKANECLVLIKLQDVLLGVLMVLLIHDRYFVDSQVVSDDRVRSLLPLYALARLYNLIASLGAW